MDRRNFVRAGIAAGTLGPSALAAQRVAEDRHYYELRVYEMRSDLAPNRIRTFFKDHLIPALQRAGAGPVGAFSPEVGMLGGTLVLLIDYPAADSAIAAPQRLQADAAYVRARTAFEGEAQPPFVRYESRLLRAFANHPRVEVPPGDAARQDTAPRVFELRTYESRNAETLAKKIDMFNQAEIALFRSIDMTPVFFGENVYATRLPSLSYMLTFDTLAAREKAWTAFRTHPEWQRIQKDPRWTAEGGITTVTSSVLLNPLPFSEVR
jgi:NIPSNAP